jgi:hypothetical protein
MVSFYDLEESTFHSAEILSTLLCLCSFKRGEGISISYEL